MKSWLAAVPALLVACSVSLLPAVAGAQAPTVSLAGIVVDETGGAIAGATVAASADDGGAARARTSTNAEGRFSFQGLAPGTYSIEATKPGFSPVRVSVSTSDERATDTARLVLRVSPVAESVDVVATSEAGYSPRFASAATRTAAAIETIPQSIVTIPRAMIDDQGARTLADALRNVSNVAVLDQRDVNNVGFKIRGFNSATVVDGVVMPGYFPGQESVFDVQRIDVVKGPSGALFGSGQAGGSYSNLGGTVAITTAAPLSTPVRQFAARLGNYGERGVSADVSQPLGRSLAARLVVDVSHNDSETAGVFFDRRALFPSLAWRPRAATSLTIRGRYLANDTIDYSGLPTFGTLDTSTVTLSREMSIVATGLPDTTNRSNGVNLQFSHALTGQWSLSAIVAHNRATVDQRGTWLVDATHPFGCFAYGTVQASFNIMCGARLWDQFHTTTISPSSTGVFIAGRTTHTVNLGIDHERTDDDAFMSYPNLFGPVSFQPVSLTSATYPAWSEPLAPATPEQQNRYTATVAYAQEQFDAGVLHLLGSLRYSTIDVTDVNALFGINNVSSNQKVTPRIGGVVDVTPQVSAFVGFNKGIKVPTVSLFSTPPKPEESQQTEVGLRTRNLAGLTATIAWFDLTRKNVAIADPARPGFAIQVGEQHSRGVDADVRWQPVAGLTVIGALTRQTPEIVDAGIAALAGTQLFNVPKTSVRIAGRWDARSGRASGLGAGLGVTYHSELPGNSPNTFFTPAAAIADGQVSYTVGKLRLGLNATNLLDRKYFIPSNYFGGNQVIPAMRRTVSLTARVSM